MRDWYIEKVREISGARNLSAYELKHKCNGDPTHQVRRALTGQAADFQSKGGMHEKDSAFVNLESHII